MGAANEALQQVEMARLKGKFKTQPFSAACHSQREIKALVLDKMLFLTSIIR